MLLNGEVDKTILISIQPVIINGVARHSSNCEQCLKEGTKESCRIDKDNNYLMNKQSVCEAMQKKANRDLPLWRIGLFYIRPGVAKYLENIEEINDSYKILERENEALRKENNTLFNKIQKLLIVINKYGLSEEINKVKRGNNEEI